MTKEKNTMNIVRYIILGVVALVMLYPLMWMVGGIWQGNTDILSPSILPGSEGVQDGWAAIVQGFNTTGRHNLLHFFWNSLLFLVPRVVAQVASCVLTAYAISRFNFVGKKLVFSLVIATLLMPDVVLRIPMFMLWRDFGLLGTFFPLWLEFAFATGSFFVFMLIQFMRTVPRDLDEAAKIDGCNSLGILIKILIPCMKPAIITVALLTFMWGMNDFLTPLIYISEPARFPLSVGLRLASDNASGLTDTNVIMAMSTLALIPAIVVFFVAQRYFIDGIATTGSKE